MRNDWISIPLEDLGTLRVQGPDATRFLQGQLSNDLARLSPAHSLLAGYHNPQGRVIAFLRLVWLDAEDFLAILPRELASGVAARLSKFILRAKVKIADESAAWHAAGLVGPQTCGVAQPRGIVQTSGVALASNLHGQTTQGSSIFVRVGTTPARWLSVTPANSPMKESPDAPRLIAGDRETWHRLDIAAGQPQVFAATSEEFVAQMLNLDVLDAVAFDKGCFTGQEVIARAHYRGRVKRRLQRFATRAPLKLTAGSAGRLNDGRPFKVVDAVQIEDGRCEFLAVAPLVSAEAEATEPEATKPAATEPEATEPEATERAPPQPTPPAVDAQALPLPYVLPE